MHKMQEIQMSNKRKINDFDAQNVGNRNVQKRQINDIGVQNVRYINVYKRQINDFGAQNVGNRNG